MKGTLLNTATVAAGALIGWPIGEAIPEKYKEIVIWGLALVTAAVAIKMSLQSKNPLVLALAMAFGGCLGAFIGIQAGIVNFADWAKAALGARGRFNEAIITTSVLFCVGPMTIIGCLEDALEGKSDLLRLKSTLDGIAAIFFAAALGPGVLVTAAVVLVFQGALTLIGRPLRGLAEDSDLMAELSGVGGVMLIGTALRMLDIKQIPVADYLPALFFAPFFVWLGRRFKKPHAEATG